VPVIDERFPESDVYREPPSDKTRAAIAATVAAARDVDVIVAVLGETEDISQESASRISLDLPGNQEDLLEALQATGKPLVLVLSNGRPLSINWAAKHVSAIVELWFPGEPGGSALADVLFGDYNPSGRLPITFPKSAGQIPFNFPAHPGAQARDGGQVSGPLYPFGYGLSYTTFNYSNVSVTPERAAAGATFTVGCDVTNNGARAGEEVVQLYLRDDYTSVVTFDEELRGFTRVKLAPGETKHVQFEVKPEHLMLYDRDGKWSIEPGRFTVGIGASSADLRLRTAFTVTRPDGSAPTEAPVH
jgi:beta-glucosidase